jgi:hypothetical protein
MTLNLPEHLQKSAHHTEKKTINTIGIQNAGFGDTGNFKPRGRGSLSDQREHG